MIGRRDRLGRRMGLRRPPDGAKGAPFWPKAGPGSPDEALDAPSRPLRPTAKRRVSRGRPVHHAPGMVQIAPGERSSRHSLRHLCRPDGVASSVTMHETSLPPSSLPDNKCQPVMIVSSARFELIRLLSGA
jgi:hypothetical protein